jgi:hypothetical protein
VTEHLVAIEQAVAKASKAAEKAQQMAGSSVKWREVCAQLSEVRRSCFQARVAIGKAKAENES